MESQGHTCTLSLFKQKWFAGCQKDEARPSREPLWVIERLFCDNRLTDSLAAVLREMADDRRIYPYFVKPCCGYRCNCAWIAQKMCG